MAVKFNEQRILKHVEGSGRGFIQYTILKFTWRDYGNPPDSSPMTVIVPAGIQTGHLPNTHQCATA
jgi:hypothetical protein